MCLSIIKKSPSDVLIKDLVKGLLQQGVAEVDIKASMAKAGIQDDMARSMVMRVTEELEVEGLGTSKSIARTEVDSALFDWGRDFEAKIDERLDGFRENQDALIAELERERADSERGLVEIESIKNDMKDLTSSVKSFETLAKEILKALKKT